MNIKDLALKLGFERCGFARALPLEEVRPFYASFASEKRHANLDYLQRYAEERLNPELLLPGVKSVIAVAMNYFPAQPVTVKDNYQIARYARGGNYHTLMKERLKAFTRALNAFSDAPKALNQTEPGNHSRLNPIRSRYFTDSGPVLEKRWAQRCGIGWQGKNTLLVLPDAGSFYFIGIVLTTLELPPDTPETDHCGSCRKCVDACPTNALHTPYQLDINRCIAYHTIENRGEIPPGIKENLKNWIYGCDICQEVCPHNHHAKPSPEPWFNTIPEILTWRKKEWESLSPETFDRIFSRGVILRKGYETLSRNIRFVQGE